MVTASTPPRPNRRVRTPTLLQMEALECGAASLGIVLGYYKKFIPLEELRLACGVSRDGSKASNVLKAGRQYGLVVKGFRMEPDTALAQAFPSIVFWNFNHFLVVEGVKGDKVFLNDPAAGPRTITRQDFDQSFTGVILTLEPGPDFEPGGQPRSLIQDLGWRLQGSKMALIYVILASLLLVVPGILVPGFSKIFIDDYLVHGKHNWIVPLLIGMGLTLILRMVLTWLQQVYMLRLETKFALTSSATFLWHVLRCPVEFFTQRYAGDLSQRVQSNDKVARLLSGDLGTSVVDLVTVVFYAVVMALYDWVLMLGALGFSLCNIIMVKHVQRRRTDTSMRLMQERGKVIGTGMGGLQIIETLKATGSEDDFFSRWAGYHAKLVNSEQELGFFNQSVSVLPTFLSSLSTAMVLGLGGFRVIEGVLTVGSLVAFQSLMSSFNQPITKLVEVSGRAQEIRGDLARLNDVLRYRRDPRLETSGETTPLPQRQLAGRIDLHDLSYGYSRLDPPLIEGFDLHVEPGARVALVGGSGSGKSTLARLIAGLYRPWKGEIVIDGMPLDDIPNDRLAHSLASVDQDIFLFDGTVRENLSLWDDTVSDEKLTQATKDACIYDVIAARPGSFDSHIESGGGNFSGGQAQRLEIARALIHDPSILILDEATSALDSMTEMLIDNNLRRRGCTCIIVAHRLSTIRDCDEIIVLDRGKVVERGTHDSLLKTGGPYATLIAAT